MFSVCHDDMSVIEIINPRWVEVFIDQSRMCRKNLILFHLTTMGHEVNEVFNTWELKLGTSSGLVDTYCTVICRRIQSSWASSMLV